MPQKVLIVAGDSQAETRLVKGLSSAGHEPEAVPAAGALKRSMEQGADIILLDLDGLGIDGSRLSQSLRATDPDRPILVLSSRSELSARLNAFQSGADDYLVKPFDLRELLARMQALLRRLGARKLESVARLNFGDVAIDFITGSAVKSGVPIALSQKEMQLLRYLASYRNSVVSREELLTNVWGYRSSDTRTVDMHVAGLRKKIEEDPQNPKFVLTVRGQGYRFCS